jgi:dihydrolipoamide dehydrogenase
MVVGQIPEPVDLLVLGGGVGGYTAALHAASLGRSVVLVDAGGGARVGGICLHEGCIPSKALIELANRAEETRAFAPAGLRIPEVGVDLAAFQEWKTELVEQLADGIRRQLAAAGVEIVAGMARFTRSNQVAVHTNDDRACFYEFADVLIAAGSRASAPPGFAPDGERILDAAAALDLTDVPASLLVVGAGSVGVELGTAYAKLGSQVTLVEQADRVLPGLDAALVRPVRRRLDKLGIEVLVDAGLEDLDAATGIVKTADGQTRVPAGRVLIAVGRRANTDELGLVEAGLPRGAGGLLEVGPDRRLTEHVAAVGDVTAGPPLAHKATAEARVAVEALCGRRVAFDPLAVPVVVYGDPEVASVGMTVDEATAMGMDVRTVGVPLRASGRAATVGAAEGTTQLVLEGPRGTIVGVHAVGPHVSEFIAEGALAIEMGASVEDLGLTIHPHPTLAEQLADAARIEIDRTRAAAGRDIK